MSITWVATELIRYDLIFSWPEPKAQVSFSGHKLSVVRHRRRRCRSCRKHFHLLLQNHWANFSLELLGRFQSNLVRSILGWRGFKFGQMKNNNHSILTKESVLFSSNQWYGIIKCVDLNWFLRWAKWPMGLLVVLVLRVEVKIVMTVGRIDIIIFIQNNIFSFSQWSHVLQSNYNI